MRLGKTYPYNEYFIDSIIPLNEVKSKEDIVLFLTDAPSKKALETKNPLANDSYEHLGKMMQYLKFAYKNIVFLTATPHMPDSIYSSDKKKTEFIKEYKNYTHTVIKNLKPKLIVAMGATAINTLKTRKVNITSARGTFDEVVLENQSFQIYPMLSLNMGLVQPKYNKLILADLNRLKRYIQSGFSIEKTQQEKNYEICTDLTELLKLRPEIIAVDTETTGLHYKDENHYPFLLQISYKKHHSLLVPLIKAYWPEEIRDHDKLIAQVTMLMRDKGIRKVGHNFKFDYHMLNKIGIKVSGWTDDTMLMMRFVDENIQRKSLNEGAKLFVPDMAGFNDEVEQLIDKTKMIEEPKERMLKYAGGDTDATLQLYHVLDKLLDKAPRHKNIYKTIYMPAMKVVADTMEKEGMLIDVAQLTETSKLYERLVLEKEKEIKDKIPQKAKNEWIKRNKNVNLNSVQFKQFVLFSEYGYNLTPRSFTKGTAKLDDSEKVGSTDKQHLEQLKDECDLCIDLLEYNKIQKLSSTYIGKPATIREPAKGMFKHLYASKIYPSYLFHRTVTARLASENPNGQNLPKRGDGAKKFREAIVAPKGWKIVEVDFSQMEVRIMACIANVQAMIDAYKKDQDLHEVTAVKNLVKGNNKILAPIAKQKTFDDVVAEFHTWEESENEELVKAYEWYRYCAKAPNFGLIYLMSVKGYKDYARDTYGRKDITLELAEQEVTDYYDAYPELLVYFEKQKDQVHEKGYVENLVGLRRHLPEINSNSKMLQAEAERQSVNFPDQSLGAWITLCGLIRMYMAMQLNKKFKENAKMIGTIHDSVLLLVNEKELDYCLPIVDDVMSNPPFKELHDIELPIGFPVDFTIGDTFNTKTKWKKKDISTVIDYVRPNFDFESVLYE